ncbi:unnamed protein product [Prorocentrum cordatum]|uniref:GPI ethanolamine phosphate transferase 1 n=1 Tax=Prorocentrum cordatum TaxID=2364126 RepID=A0ABN9WGD8_9DINO|nr:unnamed protein product [Polarella glacialis]
MTLGSIFASHISLSSLRLPHLAQQRKRPLPLVAFLVGADPSAVADDVGLQLRLPHLAQQRKRPLPLLAFLARADPSAVAMTSGSTFASHISLSSVSAGCQCPPFSHALIPAL